MKQFVCSVCGYVHNGDEAPARCPQCRVPKEKFIERAVEVEEEVVSSGSADYKKLLWADEHRVGVAKGLDPWVIEQLQYNFSGECTEVGMYLAMSRQADREGFPEIAEAYKRIAFEEAEHAAKFAELLGEVVSAKTIENLKARVGAEQGACEGKLALAKKAKELGYDAIHDTVHEMCKDEARHGAAFEGLLNRHFKK